MEPAKGRNFLIIGAGGAVLAIIVTAYFLFVRTPETTEIPTLDSGPDVAAQVSGAVETPAEKLPETNPFSNYKNPFE